MTPTKQQIARPNNTLNSQQGASKLPSSSNLPTIVSPLTTFQSNNNTTRISQYTPTKNITNMASSINEPIDNSQIKIETPHDVSPSDSSNNAPTYAKAMQQNFKDEMQAIKQSLKCNVIEDELSNQMIANEARSNDYLHSKNTDDENEGDEGELVILANGDMSGLNFLEQKSSSEEVQQFLDNEKEW